VLLAYTCYVTGSNLLVPITLIGINPLVPIKNRVVIGILSGCTCYKSSFNRYFSQLYLLLEAFYSLVPVINSLVISTLSSCTC
jgi:hypothetical protein